MLDTTIALPSQNNVPSSQISQHKPPVNGNIIPKPHEPLSPKQEMQRRKVEEADKRKNELLQFQQSSNFNSSETYSVVERRKLIQSSIMPFSTGQYRPIESQQSNVSRSQSSTYSDYKSAGSASFNQKRNFNPNRSLPSYGNDSGPAGEDDVPIAHESLFKRNPVNYDYDNRPITPMHREQSLFRSDLSNEQLKEELLETAEGAEHYYAMHNEEFENNEGETLRYEETAGDTVRNFLEYLEKIDDEHTTLLPSTLDFKDDEVAGIYGKEAKLFKIKNLKGEIVKQLGEKKFKAVYKDMIKRNDIKADPSKILQKHEVSKDVGFKLDQLIFLEKFDVLF